MEDEQHEEQHQMQPKALSEVFGDVISTIKENYVAVWIIIFVLIILYFLFKRFQNYQESKPVKYEENVLERYEKERRMAVDKMQKRFGVVSEPVNDNPVKQRTTTATSSSMEP